MEDCFLYKSKLAIRYTANLISSNLGNLINAAGSYELDVLCKRFSQYFKYTVARKNDKIFHLYNAF
jgi:hypothetical protein